MPEATACCTACATAEGGHCTDCLGTGHPHAGGLGECCNCGLGEYPHPPHEEGLRTLHPVLCMLEYWDGEEWVLGHRATNLLYPYRYIKRLAANGKVGRVTMLDSGVLLQDGEAERGKVDPVLARLRKPFPCPWCDTAHPLPHDGMCLL